MTENIYNDEAIIRSVTYHGKAGHKISLELNQEGWERLKGMETTRCMMVLVPIQNDGQPDPDAKPYPSDAEVKMLGGSRSDKPREKWSECSPTKQAHIRCNDVDFQAWLGCFDAEEAGDRVRGVCGVSSRSLLTGNEIAAALWRTMDNDFLERNLG